MEKDKCLLIYSNFLVVVIPQMYLKVVPSRMTALKLDSIEGLIQCSSSWFDKINSPFFKIVYNTISVGIFDLDMCNLPGLWPSL